jgi:hypothetical protein
MKRDIMSFTRQLLSLTATVFSDNQTSLYGFTSSGQKKSAVCIIHSDMKYVSDEFRYRPTDCEYTSASFNVSLDVSMNKRMLLLGISNRNQIFYPPFLFKWHTHTQHSTNTRATLRSRAADAFVASDWMSCSSYNVYFDTRSKSTDLNVFHNVAVVSYSSVTLIFNCIFNKLSYLPPQ